MKITKKQFKDFWHYEGQYMRISNRNRREMNLADKVEELGSTSNLDNYVKSLRTGKESTRKIIVKFYDYLMNKEGFDYIESDLYNKDFYGAVFERQLEIAKFLHKKRSTKEISDYFCISERTVRKDLQELEEGITVFDTTIQISKEKIGREYYYITTLHPIFLPLNLTEVYALTVYLNKEINDSNPNKTIVKNISSRIKGQLSEYAMERLFPDDIEDEVKNYYIDDEDLAKQREGIRMYLMKSGVMCKFIWKDTEYRGKIDRDYNIVLENGEYLAADIDEIDFIIEGFDYE